MKGEHIMNIQKQIVRIVLVFCLVSLLALSAHQIASAGTNGQQLRFYNFCYAQSVRIIGSNNNGDRVDKTFSTDASQCNTAELKGWWWKGTVYVTVFYPDTTYQRVITNVPQQQNTDWWGVTIPTIPDVVLRGYKWVKVNVKYGSFDNDPSNDYYSADYQKYSNRPKDTSYYRTDCSGFISYAWNLGTSKDTVGLGTYAKDIAYSGLQPGDIINNKQSGVNGHVILFVRWTDKNNNEFWAYEDSYGQGTVLSTIRLVVDNNGNITALKKLGASFYTYGNGPWFAQRKP
jgi:hypothetical protein